MSASASLVDPWLLERLACPRDHGRLHQVESALVCPGGHRFPVVDGVPVLLLDTMPTTMAGLDRSLQRARGEGADPRAPELYLESLGISDEEKAGVVEMARQNGPIDPVVAYLVAATNGLMYRHLIGSLTRYPIPAFPMADGAGRLLVDVGCSWGRWSLAAHAKGYAVIGVDPSLGAVMAARRVARQLGAPNRYVVGDARCLPLASGAVDVAYSYSVLQHLSPEDASLAVGEIARVLKPAGLAKVQMPTRLGIRCLYHQARRGFREASGFDVRYWSLAALRRLFGVVGAPTFEVDAYFGIGLQRADRALMGPARQLVLRLSEALKALSRAFTPLVWVADSVFVTSVRRAGA